MPNISQDLTLAVRRLVHHGRFTIFAIIILGCGIGPTMALVSMISQLVLRSLPSTSPDQIVTFNEPDVRRLVLVPEPRFARAEWADKSHTLQDIAVYDVGDLNLDSGASPERLHAAEVSGTFFPLLGVPGLLGRPLVPRDESSGRNRVAVLSYLLWQQRYRGDRGVIGRLIMINDFTFTIVGVMPPDFDFPRKVMLWVPLPTSLRDELLSSGSSSGYQLARLNNGATINDVRVELRSIIKKQGSAYPCDPGEELSISTLQNALVGDIKPALIMLFGAALLILLIASANVSGLLLARSMARSNEYAIRFALGASYTRVLLLPIAEGVALAMAGSFVAIGLAIGILNIGRHFIFNTIPALSTISIDWPAVAFVVLFSSFIGVAVGTWPAIQIARTELGQSSKTRGIAVDFTTRHTADNSMQHVLGVAEVALACVLLLCAGLLLCSFSTLLAVEPGFKSNGLLVSKVSLLENRYDAPSAMSVYVHRALRVTSNLPGVISTAFIDKLPLDSGTITKTSIALTPTGSPVSIEPVTVSKDCFITLGIPVVQGRSFNEDDGVDHPLVAAVSSSLARKYWGTHAVGERFLLTGTTPQRWYTIVGVVGDTHMAGLKRPPLPSVYFPFDQHRQRAGYFLVRSQSSSTKFRAVLANSLRSIDPDEPTPPATRMDFLLSQSVSRERTIMLLLSMFALLALFLAVVGVYSILSFSVGESVREIAIRMALGASPASIIRFVIAKGLLIVAVGEIFGVMGFVVLAPLLRAFLYQVKPLDAITLVTVPVIVLGAAVAACYLPAQRAMKLEPAQNLRA
jgi:predicted permease